MRIYYQALITITVWSQHHMYYGAAAASSPRKEHESSTAHHKIESDDSVQAIQKGKVIDFDAFTELLDSEIHHELTRSPGSNNDPIQVISEEDDFQHRTNTAWNAIVQHGWDMYSRKVEERGSSRHLTQSSTNSSRICPYLVCSHSSTPKSAYQRLKPMLKRTQSHLDDFVIIRNDPHRTCFHVSMRHEEAAALKNDSERTFNHSKEEASETKERIEDSYSIVPMVDLMKVQRDTFRSLSDGDDSNGKTFQSKNDDWEHRVISVVFSVGHRKHQGKTSAQNMASLIINEVRSAGQTGARHRSQRRRLKNDHINEEYDAPTKNGEETSTTFGDGALQSLSDMFSMIKDDNEVETHVSSRSSSYRQLLRGRQNSEAKFSTDTKKHNQWSSSLQLGLEANHGCETMFKTLDINVHYDNEGFDIVLKNNEITNHNDGIEKEREEMTQQELLDHKKSYQQCNKGIEKSCSSASNKHCIISLVMGLATHPMVMSIETNDGPVHSNDYESQWITQTKVLGSRPLRSLGINGENQIISVVDSGLDINHKYFGPTHPRVFDQWDYTQRKVVRYDHSIGDKKEGKKGHGTKVAGAAAGRFIDNVDDEANGIAHAAKLHVFDIQIGSGGLRMPPDLAYRLFRSMHSTEQTPARVAVGSFNTRYRSYPFSCKFFDEALHGPYKGDLYVASAGNDGLDEGSIESKMRTIGNPASCKNTLAVGASQSHGVRISRSAKGIDYVAAFSSRGPTYDGRMKPDLVAPGASVLTPKAHESSATVQAYGTSYSAPNVAGNAALVRQYFEEGHLPCARDDCSIDPSGSLVKAVLMNSARSLKQVQVVSRPWIGSQELEEVSEYDSNQGMGLIQLDKTLPIQKHNRINAIIRNDEQIKDQQFHDIFIRATPHKCLGKSYIRDFSVTLAWYDPAGSANCAKCLINDLDIMVHEVNADRSIRNETQKFPNGLSHKDYDNNVERIRFRMVGSRRYRIRISASNLATMSTHYSMIASGCMKVIADSVVGTTV